MSNPRFLRSRGQGPNPSPLPQRPQHPFGVKQTVEAQEVGMRTEGTGPRHRPAAVQGPGLLGLAVGMECQPMLPRGCVANGHGASLAPGREPVPSPPGQSVQQRGERAGWPGACSRCGEGASGSRPGEKLYIHQNLKQKPHSRLSARLWLLW